MLRSRAAALSRLASAQCVSLSAIQHEIHLSKEISSQLNSQLTRLLCSYRRYISSSVVLLGDKRSERIAAFATNKKIVNLGGLKDWEKILKLYEQERGKFNSVNYATVMTQLGRINSFNMWHPVFLRFLDDLANNIEQSGLRWIGVREVSTIIHAMGKMRLSNNTGRRIIQWMSKLENAQEFLAKAEPQCVSNVAWAFARLKFIPNDFFEEMNKRAQWLVIVGSPQTVANTAWACAKLCFNASNLFAEIDRRAEWLVKEGKPQEVANTAWSYATLGIDAPNLFAVIDRHAEWLVKKGDSQAIANTAWSCAMLGFDAPNLFAKIDDHAEWLVKKGKPQEVANIAWSFSTLGFDSPNIFVDIEASWDELLPKLKEKNISNLCFAIAIAGLSVRFKGILVDLWDRIMRMHSWDGFDDEARLQLAQGVLYAKIAGIDLPESLLVRTSWAVKGGWAVKGLEANTVTESQRAIASILHELGFSCGFHVSPLSSVSFGEILAIDLACKKRKIAIEYNEPCHFLKELGTGKVTSSENGPTKAKRRFLEQLGWRVINVDYRDWIATQCEGDERPWLREKLCSAGIALSNNC